MHKRSYPRSLNLKIVLPHLQTLRIAGTAASVPAFTGMTIDAVAAAIGSWLPSLMFLLEMNEKAHRVVVQSFRDLIAHPDNETSSAAPLPTRCLVVPNQPPARVRIQRLGDGEKDARF